MATMNISLPDSLKSFVQERLDETEYSNASDYVRSLIRKDKEQYLQEKLEQKLLEGLESGEAKPIDQAFWEKLNQRIDQADQ